MAIITISRGTFSGGRTLGVCLSERLGYPCLDREGVLESASRYGIPVEKLVSALEVPPSFWERLTGYRNRYLNFVRAALCDQMVEGNLVYHGHAGHLLLPKVSHVICVHVIADMEYRIQAAMRNEKLTRKDAIAYIEKMDRQRAQWTRFLYGVDWCDPSLYDVVLNLNRIPLSDACDAVASLTELRAFKPTAESLRVMGDLTLSSRVWAILASNPATRDADLETEAADGLVTITGTTHFPAVFESIPSVAAHVAGVKRVVCQVRETSKTYP